MDITTVFGTVVPGSSPGGGTMKDRQQLLRAVEQFGTPLYVYDRAVLRDQCKTLRKNFPDLGIHYAVKANSNPTILREIAQQGLGAEAVSLGELAAAEAAGFPRDRISFTCSNLTEEELRIASKKAGRVHLDSLRQLEVWGRLKLGSSVSLRLNQGIGAGHHAHVITGGPDSKFGITLKDIPAVFKLARTYRLSVTGLQQHVGSNVLDYRLLLMAARTLVETAETFPDVTYLDFGGGLGIPYKPTQKPLDIEAYGRGLKRVIEQAKRRFGKEIEFSLEPGRYVVAESGTLLVEVVDLKKTDKHAFVGVNSGFNQLIRPAFYDSYHHIENVTRPKGKTQAVTVAGNVCESGDIFARKRPVAAPRIGDLLAIRTSGAYGFSMASAYNLRRLPKEVLIAGATLTDISFSPTKYVR